ncbi:hypothetical protein K435DRAFT_672308, partial [Dendrothele bispora CBS 962.96]
LTAQFVNNNPADEMELITLGLSGSILSFYSFPDCTTLWNPQPDPRDQHESICKYTWICADPVGNPEFVVLPRGSQFSLGLDPTRDDAWCQDEQNNLKPALSFQVQVVFVCFPKPF